MIFAILELTWGALLPKHTAHSGLIADLGRPMIFIDSNINPKVLKSQISKDY